MKARSKLAAIAMCALALGVSVPIAAQEKKGPNKGKPTAAAPSSQAAGVEAIHTARQLARYGDANKDALALIVAARMIKEAGASESQAKLTGGKPSDAKNKPDEFTVQALIERAKATAGGRADLVALADDVGKSGTRGAVGGPGRQVAVIGTRRYQDYRAVFRGGEPARVAASGDGDSDLDLYVYDEFGNLICRDERYSDEMFCAWNPNWTGPFRIRVVNRGGANEFLIVHN